MKSYKVSADFGEICELFLVGLNAKIQFINWGGHPPFLFYQIRTWSRSVSVLRGSPVGRL